MKQKFYSLAFILYLFFSFIGQFFILNRVFGEGVGTVLIGCSFFHWAFGIVSSTSCFCQQKGQETHKYIGFRIYFCRFCIWFSPCWGEDLPLLCLAWSHFLQMRWSMQYLPESNPWSKISCKAKARAFFMCSHHFLEVGDLCLGLFLLALKRSWKWIFQMTLQALVWRENLL